MAHIHEKIDFTASVYLVHEGKVLLHKHKKLGFWVQPGGHIELDEDPNQAAIREAKEETGYDVELIGNPQLSPVSSDQSGDLIPPKFLNRHRFNDRHEHIDFVYFGRVKSGELLPEDGAEMRWVGREEIENNTLDLKPDVRAYALTALAEFSVDD